MELVNAVVVRCPLLKCIPMTCADSAELPMVLHKYPFIDAYNSGSAFVN